MRASAARSGADCDDCVVSAQRLLAKSTSGWMVGSSLTVADLATYGRVMSFKGGKYDNIPATICDAFPLVSGAFCVVSATPAPAWCI